MSLLNRKRTPGEIVQAGAVETSILAVIVIYKMKPGDSASLRTLLEAARAAMSTALRLSILVVDNTPGGQDAGVLPDGVRYRAEPENPGLAKPYNDALATAEKEGFTWLLTLDQDTHLPAAFLTALDQYAKHYHGVDNVAAIVPRIVDNGRPISPFRFVGGFLPRVLPPSVSGISKRFTSSLNSASLLRVAALRKVGGYDVRFPLHNSDTSLFHNLDKAGERVVVAGDILVSHDLAILQREDRMTPQRYRQLLWDECDFWDVKMGFLARTERLLRLVGRVCKGYLRNEDVAFRAITSAEIRRRCLTPRRQRMRAKTAHSALG